MATAIVTRRAACHGAKARRAGRDGCRYVALRDAALRKDLKAALAAMGFEPKQIAAIRGMDGHRRRLPGLRQPVPRAGHHRRSRRRGEPARPTSAAKA